MKMKMKLTKDELFVLRVAKILNPTTLEVTKYRKERLFNAVISLYNKKLIIIDFKNDKLFFNKDNLSL